MLDTTFALQPNFSTSPAQLQRDGIRECVRPRGSAHCNPERKRVGTELFFGGTCGGRYSSGNSERDRSATLITTGSVYSDTLNAVAVGGSLPC
jgi:hypothetical protein